MKRAGQLQYWPARQSVSTRDEGWLSRRVRPVNRGGISDASSDVIEMVNRSTRKRED